MSSAGVSRDHSIFANTFTIPSIAFDLSQWDAAWEQALPTLSASQDVFPIMSEILKMDQPGSSVDSANMPKRLRAQLCRILLLVTKIWGELDNTWFSVAWMTLREEDRKNHMLNGMKEACEYAPWGQDARALCPDITISAMMKGEGRGFTNLVKGCAGAVKQSGPGHLYFLWSEWWEQAVELPEPWPDDVVSAFDLLTMHRNQFMATFALHTLASLMRDSVYATSPLAQLVKSDGFGSTMKAGTRDKPSISCEHCTRSPDELERGRVFMVCGRCKSYLSFAVHYCSQPCQKDDWPTHKQRCGKTIPTNQPDITEPKYWEFTTPLDIAPFRSSLQDRPIKCEFPRPHPSRPHSPALRRQYSMLEADGRFDYYLFDESGQPVPFRIKEHSTEPLAKLCWGLMWEQAISYPVLQGAEVLAEYLIKTMSDKPGLSEARIRAQFTEEYGEDMPYRMTELRRMKLRNGYELGIPFLDSMSEDMSKRMLTDRWAWNDDSDDPPPTSARSRRKR